MFKIVPATRIPTFSKFYRPHPYSTVENLDNTFHEISNAYYCLILASFSVVDNIACAVGRLFCTGPPGPGYYLCSIKTTSAPWPLDTLLHTSEFPGLPPTPPPFSLNMGTPWQLIDNITAREFTLQVEIKNIFRWKVIVDFYGMNMIKYFMNVSLYFEAVLLCCWHYGLFILDTVESLANV